MPFRRAHQEGGQTVDAESLKLLQADLAAQVAEIERCYRKIHQRQEGFAADEERLESLAFHLHNLYCVFEDLFRMIAEAFENQIEQGGGWHVELLSRMRQEIPGVRPAVVEVNDLRALNELRAFRHVFRHAYALELNPAKLAIVLEQALVLEPRVRPIVDRFLAACRSALHA